MWGLKKPLTTGIFSHLVICVHTVLTCPDTNKYKNYLLKLLKRTIFFLLSFFYNFSIYFRIFINYFCFHLLYFIYIYCFFISFFCYFTFKSFILECHNIFII